MPRGGAVAGGIAETLPPPIVPGFDCAHAALIELGTTYGPFSINLFNPNWFRFDYPAGTTFKVDFVTDGGFDMVIFMAQGPCPASVNQAQRIGTGCCSSAAFLAGPGTIYISVFNVGGPHTFSFTANAGAC